MAGVRGPPSIGEQIGHLIYPVFKLGVFFFSPRGLTTYESCGHVMIRQTAPPACNQWRPAFMCLAANLLPSDLPTSLLSYPPTCASLPSLSPTTTTTAAPTPAVIIFFCLPHNPLHFDVYQWAPTCLSAIPFHRRSSCTLSQLSVP